MSGVWIFIEQPAYQEGRVIGVFATPMAARRAWFEESDGSPMPRPDESGAYADHGLGLFLTRYAVISNPRGEPDTVEQTDYIYLEDDCSDRHYCSRCGEPVFTDMARREPHDVWTERIDAHRTCKPAGGE